MKNEATEALLFGEHETRLCHRTPKFGKTEAKEWLPLAQTHLEMQVLFFTTYIF